MARCQGYFSSTPASDH